MIWGVVVAGHQKTWIVKIQESLHFPCVCVCVCMCVCVCVCVCVCTRDKHRPYQEASCLKGDLCQRGTGPVELKAQRAGSRFAGHITADIFFEDVKAEVFRWEASGNAL